MKLLPLSLLLIFSAALQNILAQTVKPKVLLLSTFHMKPTSDLRSLSFNPNDPKRKKEIEGLNQRLMKFSPTIICVERPPEKQAEIDADYQDYLTKGETKDKGEVALIAFSIAKSLHLNKVYGIDNKLDYNYQVVSKLADSTDNRIFKEYLSSNLSIFRLFENKTAESLTLTELLRQFNTQEALNELYNLNAGIFPFVASKAGFEGADVAADYYKRNLRIYSNLNKVPIKSNDRVLVIMGGSHISFLKEFISKAPFYELVNPEDYLK